MATATSPAEVHFAFEDLGRQTFVALNSSHDGYHFVRPADAWDPRVTGRYLKADGDVGSPIVQVGELVCSCRGAFYRGGCYVVEAAKLRLEVDFSDPSLGAGASVEAYRG